MVASSSQQETVMDTRKVETRTLSDDQLDAVSGGAPSNNKPEVENKKQADALKAFQSALQQLV
jgi:hypothetical protein